MGTDSWLGKTEEVLAELCRLSLAYPKQRDLLRDGGQNNAVSEMSV